LEGAQVSTPVERNDRVSLRITHIICAFHYKGSYMGEMSPRQVNQRVGVDAGDKRALARLTPSIYEGRRRTDPLNMAHERRGLSPQPTASADDVSLRFVKTWLRRALGPEMGCEPSKREKDGA
jgi:hypothetical protein